MSRKCLTSWSGGKDSCYALHKAVEQGYVPVAVLNMMNENGKFSRSHAIPKNVLEAQADALGIPIHTCPASWEAYEKSYITSLQNLKARFEFDCIVFGDIDLEPHREWEEKVSKTVGLEAVLPLWLQDRKALVYEMIDRGIEAIIVSCNDQMGPNFLGEKIDKALVLELEKIGVDACGENGEYHTLVLNCPLFKNRVDVDVKGKLWHKKYNFLEFELA